MKYKVGDRVRVKPLQWFRDNCKKSTDGSYYFNNNSNYFCESMFKFCEEEVEIIKDDVKSSFGDSYYIKTFSFNYKWHDWMFEDLEPAVETKEVEMEEIIIPFDIEKAKAGAELITTTGKKARIISYDRICGYYSIVALVLDGIESVCYFNNNGECQFDNKLKLMIKDYRPKNQTELTMKQIADKFGINVEDLKIKK